MSEVDDQAKIDAHEAYVQCCERRAQHDRAFVSVPLADGEKATIGSLLAFDSVGYLRVLVAETVKLKG